MWHLCCPWRARELDPAKCPMPRPHSPQSTPLPTPGPWCPPAGICPSTTRCLGLCLTARKRPIRSEHSLGSVKDDSTDSCSGHKSTASLPVVACQLLSRLVSPPSITHVYGNAPAPSQGPPRVQVRRRPQPEEALSHWARPGSSFRPSCPWPPEITPPLAPAYHQRRQRGSCCCWLYFWPCCCRCRHCWKC